MNISRILALVFLTQVWISSFAQNEQVIFPVKDVFNISGIGNVVTGKVEVGTIRSGAVLEARGRGDKVFSITVGKIYLDNKEVTSVARGEQANFQAKGIANGDLRMGMVIATPGLLQTVRQITVKVKLLETATPNLIKEGSSIQLYLHDHLVFANVLLKKPFEGNEQMIDLKFSIPVAAQVNDSIQLELNGKKIGDGVITELTVKN